MFAQAKDFVVNAVSNNKLAAGAVVGAAAAAGVYYVGKKVKTFVANRKVEKAAKATA